MRVIVLDAMGNSVREFDTDHPYFMVNTRIHIGDRAYRVVDHEVSVHEDDVDPILFIFGEEL